MDSVPVDVLPFLAGMALIAGTVDAIAGGGGLIALPALLIAGVPPLPALGTNKLQGSFGTLTASWRFWRSGQLDLRTLWLPLLATFLGASLGTWAVQQVGTELLGRLVPALLIASACYFALSPSVGDRDSEPRLRVRAFALAVAAPIGFYDGFFGPGTGSFFALAFVALGGRGLRRATAGTKALNFASNLAALLWFGASGQVVWWIGIPMGVAQIAGAWLGSHLVLRHGARLVRLLLVAVSLVTSVRLLWLG